MPVSFSVVCSNDVSIEELNPMTVRAFDDMRREVTTHLSDMCGQLVVIVKLLHLLMDVVLRNSQIPWSSCVGYGVDNASVNLGI